MHVQYHMQHAGIDMVAVFPKLLGVVIGRFIGGLENAQPHVLVLWLGFGLNLWLDWGWNVV